MQTNEDDEEESVGSSSSSNEGDEDSSSIAIDEDDDASNDDAQEADSSNSPLLPAQISKTWTTLTTHSPCYTGGTVVFSHTTAKSSDDTSSSERFILAQRGGDVSIIDNRGLLLRTVRKGKLFQSDHVLNN